jgi:tetratricopeptide (TPR) repeat protein
MKHHSSRSCPCSTRHRHRLASLAYFINVGPVPFSSLNIEWRRHFLYTQEQWHPQDANVCLLQNGKSMTLLKEQLERIEELLAEGIRAKEAGDFRTAESCFDQCFAFDDGSTPSSDENGAWEPLWIAYVQCAYLLKDQGDYESAIRRAKRALGSVRQSFLALALLGMCYEALGRLKESEYAFREAIETRKDAPEAWVYVLLFGVVHRDPPRTDESREILERAVEIEPDFDEAHYNLGIVLLEQNELDSAHLHLKKAIELTPDYSIAHCQLGVALYRQGNPESARFHLEKAIEIDPKNGVAYGELGSVLLGIMHQNLDLLFDADEVKACEDALQKAIELNPGCYWSRAKLINLYWTCERLRRAEEECRKFIERFPASSVAHWVYGDFLASTGRGRKKAESLLKKAVKLDDRDDAARYYYGKALLQWERWHEAAVMLQEAHRLGHKGALPLLRSHVSADGMPLS